MEAFVAEMSEPLLTGNGQCPLSRSGLPSPLHGRCEDDISGLMSMDDVGTVMTLNTRTVSRVHTARAAGREGRSLNVELKPIL